MPITPTPTAANHQGINVESGVGLINENGFEVPSGLKNMLGLNQDIANAVAPLNTTNLVVGAPRPIFASCISIWVNGIVPSMMLAIL